MQATLPLAKASAGSLRFRDTTDLRWLRVGLTVNPLARLKVALLNGLEAEDAQGTPTQSHVSLIISVYEDEMYEPYGKLCQNKKLKPLNPQPSTRTVIPPTSAGSASVPW